MLDKLYKVGAQTDLAHLTQDVIDWFVDEHRDMELDDYARPQVLDDPSNALAETRQKLMNFKGRLGIHGPVITQSFVSPDSRITEVIQHRYEQALHTCEEIGATHMVIHSPFLALGHPHPHTVDMITEQACDVLKYTVELAEKVACTLVIENTWDKSPELLLRLIRTINSEYVRLSLDTGHAAVTNLNGGLAPDQWIAEAGDLLGHIHLNDTDGFADRHLPVGRGSINWYSIFMELSKLTSEPRLIMEPHIELRLAQVYEEAIGWLRHQNLAK